MVTLLLTAVMFIDTLLNIGFFIIVIKRGRRIEKLIRDNDKLLKENKKIEENFNRYLQSMDEEMTKMRKKLFKKLKIRYEPKKDPLR